MRYLITALCLVVSLPAMAAKVMEWDDLVPADYDPNTVYEQLFRDIYGDRPPEDVADGDPRGERMLDAIDKAWREAPLKADLDGTEVRLPGFGVPLDGDDE